MPKHNLRLIEGIAVAGVLLTLAGGFYLRNLPEQSSAKTREVATLKVRSNSTFETLDSGTYTSSTAYQVIGNLVVGLYTRNAAGKVQPEISAGAPSVNADKTVYTFKLKHYRWSNGTPVTAADFVYAWRRLAAPATQSRNANRTDLLKNGTAVRKGQKPDSALGVTALGTHKLRVTLAAANPYFLEQLSDAPFLPINARYAKQQGAMYGLSYKHVLANGPFTISGWNGPKDTNWRLVKNPNYAQAKRVRLSKVDVTVFADDTAATTAFNSHQLDYTPLTARMLAYYEGNKQLHKQTTTTTAYLYFNTTSGATMNVHLRRALAQGFDKHGFTAGKLRNGAKPLNGNVPADYTTVPGGADYRKATGQLLPYDLDVAHHEWQKAKQALGVSQLKVTLNIADNPDAAMFAKYFKSQIEHNLPGLKIQIAATSLAKRMQLEEQGNFNVVFSTWTPADTDPYELLHFNQTDSPVNVAGFSNDHYDELLKRAVDTLGDQPAERMRTLQAAERYLLKTQVPSVGVYQAGNAYLLSNKVAKLPIGVNGVVHYAEARMR